MFEANVLGPLSNDPAIDELGILVDGIRRGDESALEALYEATVGKLYALASAILRQAEDAEEAVCATYAQAWENTSSYDGLHLAAGDANFAAAGSWHDDITTETGVLVLVRGEYPPPAYA